MAWPILFIAPAGILLQGVPFGWLPSAFTACRGWQGSGLGARLFAETLDWLQSSGPRAVWIGVWSENFGAQGLYERHGFKVVGTYKFVVGQTQDHEFIMRRG